MTAKSRKLFLNLIQGLVGHHHLLNLTYQEGASGAFQITIHNLLFGNSVHLKFHGGILANAERPFENIPSLDVHLGVNKKINSTRSPGGKRHGMSDLPGGSGIHMFPMTVLVNALPRTDVSNGLDADLTLCIPIERTSKINHNGYLDGDRNGVVKNGYGGNDGRFLFLKRPGSGGLSIHLTNKIDHHILDSNGEGLKVQSQFATGFKIAIVTVYVDGSHVEQRDGRLGYGLAVLNIPSETEVGGRCGGDGDGAGNHSNDSQKFAEHFRILFVNVCL